MKHSRRGELCELLIDGVWYRARLKSASKDGSAILWILDERCDPHDMPYGMKFSVRAGQWRWPEEVS